MRGGAVRTALKRAREDALGPPPEPAADGYRRVHRLAIGDPQAPLATFFEVLDRHGALDETGRLARDVALVSMGDHFDWGTPDERAIAAEDSLQLLAWLAAHPPDQVTLVVGNHDLARVGELADFDDIRFAKALAEADAAYRYERPIRPEHDFRTAYDVPSWEVVSRDFSTFRAAQRKLVTALLQARRFRVAVGVAPDLLLCHAGVTIDHLSAIGLSSTWYADAFAVAAALNDALDAAVGTWDRGRLAIPPLHEPGDARAEGQGVFFHRPSRAEKVAGSWGNVGRRFDPTRLPAGLTQAIGHVRDKKCRELLGIDAPPASDGPLRYLRVRGGQLRYARGTPRDRDDAAATMLFLDGGMYWAAADTYELLDLDTRTAARRSTARR